MAARTASGGNGPEGGRDADLRRRGFLRLVLSGAVGGSLLLVIPMGAARLLSGAQEDEEGGGTSNNPAGRRYVFVVDVTRCIGCGTCCVADRNEFMVPDGYYRTWVERYVIEGLDEVHVDSPQGGLNGFAQLPEACPGVARDLFFVPKLCNMCARPSCVQVCPVGATFRSREGFVLVDAKRCVGCAYCVEACPYSARFLHPLHKTASKCTWCFHRVHKGLEPVCVRACPTGARMFGDLDDPDSEVGRLLSRPEAVAVLKPEMGNKPSLYYLGLRREVI